jgi:chromosome segregation ATPase
VRQARAALAKQYENRIATLESELEACKGQLRDDDEIVEALHQRIDVLEKQGSSADGDAARLAAAESRAKTVEQECARLGTAVLELERDKADLERRLEEAEARANALASQHAALSAREGTGSEASLRAQLTELQARLSSADEQRCASLRGDQERLEKLEQERKLFKIEQRKRQAEREAMIEKLGELAAENKHLTEKLADAQRCASSAESALRETTHPEFTNKIEAAQAEARGLRQELGTREAECAELRAQAAQLAAAAQSAKQEGAAIKDKAKQKLALAR